MSRSGYSDDLDNWSLIKWRGQVTSAIRGKRGQKFFIDLAAAMDAMPVKELITGRLEEDGAYCALGVIGVARGIDVKDLDELDPAGIAEDLDIASQLAQEVMFMNDDACDGYSDGRGVWVQETPAHRWSRMRLWVADQIKESQ